MSRRPHTTARTMSVLGLPPLLELARDRGVDPTRLLRAARIPAALLDDPTARVPFERELALVRALLDRTGDPALGLEAGRRYHLGAFGLLGSAAPEAATLRDALRLFLEHIHLTYTPFAVQLEERDGVAVLRFADDIELGALRRFYVDRDFAFVCAMGETLSGRAAQVLREVAFDGPPPADLEPYRRAFPCRLRFSAAAPAIALDARALDAARPGASPLALRLLEAHLLVFEDAPSIVAAVRRALAVGVGGEAALIGAERVAAQLGMSPRTLRRQLAAAGTSFHALRDELLSRVARRHLEEGALSVEALAERLGYAEAASFVRAFRRWTGVTPDRYRRKSNLNLRRANRRSRTRRSAGARPARSSDPTEGAGPSSPDSAATPPPPPPRPRSDRPRARSASSTSASPPTAVAPRPSARTPHKGSPTRTGSPPSGTPRGSGRGSRTRA
jgi:AraC-like DNA-binding protein